jgi:phosphomannomutase
MKRSNLTNLLLSCLGIKMEKVTYCFDVDGTLTPSRSVMDEQFRKEFIEFAKTHDVCLVTGSDYPKTLEQVGQEVVDTCSFVFNCCGNEVRTKDHIRYQSTWKPGGMLLLTLEHEKRKSGFSIRTGKHIENRVGMINFSVVGRNANREERAAYVKWDEENNERVNIASRLWTMFPELDCAIAGETGLDIYPKGKDKSQVRDWIENKLVFFGDRCQYGGNDYPLAKVADVVYDVANWQETRKILGY